MLRLCNPIIILLSRLPISTEEMLWWAFPFLDLLNNNEAFWLDEMWRRVADRTASAAFLVRFRILREASSSWTLLIGMWPWDKVHICSGTDVCCPRVTSKWSGFSAAESIQLQDLSSGTQTFTTAGNQRSVTFCSIRLNAQTLDHWRTSGTSVIWKWPFHHSKATFGSWATLCNF